MLRVLLTLAFAQAALHGAQALIFDRTHESRVFGETRHHRIFLPPDYESSGKRYPVIYWFHGYSERYNKPVADTPHRNYDEGLDYGGDNIASFVAAHDVIIVKWDGYNPRTPGENYARPYNIHPVETGRQFPPYFPELVDHIDAHYRTIADREHRATSGLSMGGFMSFWIAGKYPDLVSSASDFMGSSEFLVGPREFPVEYRHDEMHGNYDGLRTRLVMGTKDFIQFYHRRMNLIWTFTRPDFETETFDFDHGTPGMAKTFDFHMRAFANPLPRPKSWSHVDVYANFSVWGWSVTSDRNQPGLTMLENVSPSGFRSSVREWIPAGRTLDRVKLSVTSAALYPPGSAQKITFIRKGEVRRETRQADSEGRLKFTLDGEETAVGIGAEPISTLAGFEVEGAAWAEDEKPVRLSVSLLNKGAGRSPASTVRWETPNPGVAVESKAIQVPALASGKMAAVPLTFTVSDPTREIVKLFAVTNGVRLPIEIPVFPKAAPLTSFEIADGRQFPVFQEGVKTQALSLGIGNGDGHANPGETFAVLVPDGDAWRAAELFSNDACLDLTNRVSDVWGPYDHVGASAKYSLPHVRANCAAGHVIRVLTRVQFPSKPNHQIRYGTIELSVR